MALITRLHEQHVRKGIRDLACILCVEAVRQRPEWLRHLRAREFETRKSAA